MKTNKTTEQAARHDAGGVANFSKIPCQIIYHSRERIVSQTKISHPGSRHHPQGGGLGVLEGMLSMLCLFTWWIYRIAVGTLWDSLNFLSWNVSVALCFLRCLPFNLLTCFCMNLYIDRCADLCMFVSYQEPIGSNREPVKFYWKATEPAVAAVYKLL